MVRQIKSCSSRTRRYASNLGECVVITMPALIGVWHALTSLPLPSSTAHMPQLPLARGRRMS